MQDNATERTSDSRMTFTTNGRTDKSKIDTSSETLCESK